MARAYSNDLRERVVAAVELDGMSCREAAAQFSVGVSTAIRWLARYRGSGSVAPAQIGGYRRKSIAGAHPGGDRLTATFVLAAPDVFAALGGLLVPAAYGTARDQTRHRAGIDAPRRARDVPAGLRCHRERRTSPPGS